MPWFPYRLTGAIIPVQTQDTIVRAVVPLQTHGCYNSSNSTTAPKGAVVPLQTHGCYNLAPNQTHTLACRGSPTDSRVL